MRKVIRIALGADHRGFNLKQFIHAHLNFDHQVVWIDVGAYTQERSDYPEFSIAACKLIIENKADYAILLCGTGIGMAVAANRFANIYAGVVWNETIARLAKEDDNINVIVLPADFITDQEALGIITAWFNAEFKYDRYQKRLAMIDALQ